MIATLDERHIARGYDPYNSADQPWVMQLQNLKRNMTRAAEGLPPTPSPAEMLAAWKPIRESDAATDDMMRRGFQHLARHGYEFFPGTSRPKEHYQIVEPTEAERRKYF